MYTLPDWATSQLAASHPVLARVTVAVARSTTFDTRLRLQSGSVQVDGTAAVRRTLDMQVVGTLADPGVDPLSAEAFVEYGVQVPDGRVAWIPVGVFVLTQTTEAARGMVRVTGVDRWQRLIDARFERPTTTSGTVVSSISALVTGADSRITFSDTTGSTATNGTAVWERDRGQAVTELAASIGAELVFDPQGVAVLRPVPTLGGAPVWSVGGGQGGMKVIGVSGRAREATYNAVVATGEAVENTTPVVAVARDTNPWSPTFYGGPFGKKPRFYASPLIRTQAQAQTAANAMLARVLGQARTLDVTSLPHPGLDAGDVIRVQVAAGAWQTHLVDGYTLPLGPGTVQLTTRSNAPDLGTET